MYQTLDVLYIGKNSQMQKQIMFMILISNLKHMEILSPDLHIHQKLFSSTMFHTNYFENSYECLDSFLVISYLFLADSINKMFVLFNF